jgi:hypothetical protein
MNLSLVIIPLVGPRKTTERPGATSIPTFVWTFSLVDASMMTVQLGLAAEFLVAVPVRADEDCFGLEVELDIV